MVNFDEYIKQGEPQKREKGYAWQTAIGLQAVDGLKPSEYLIETARKHIEGDITIDEVQQLIKSYYVFHMHVIWTKTHRKELQTKLRETS